MRENWKGSTQITQGSFVKRHITPFFQKMLLSQITLTAVVVFHKAMEAKGLGKRSRRNLHAILAKMFNHAVDLELIAKTPVKKGIRLRYLVLQCVLRSAEWGFEPKVKLAFLT